MSKHVKLFYWFRE